jgi:hypothetical protein
MRKNVMAVMPERSEASCSCSHSQSRDLSLSPQDYFAAQCSQGEGQSEGESILPPEVSIRFR